MLTLRHNLPGDAVLAIPELVRHILASIRAENHEVAKEEACRAAASWCAATPSTRAACDDDATWAELTRAVFPNARAPDPNRSDEPTAPKAWFNYLCDQLRDYRRAKAERDAAYQRFQAEWAATAAQREEAERRYAAAIERTNFAIRLMSHLAQPGTSSFDRWAAARAAQREADRLRYWALRPPSLAPYSRAYRRVRQYRRYLENLGLWQPGDDDEPQSGSAVDGDTGDEESSDDDEGPFRPE